MRVVLKVLVYGLYKIGNVIGFKGSAKDRIKQARKENTFALKMCRYAKVCMCGNHASQPMPSNSAAAESPSKQKAGNDTPSRAQGGSSSVRRFIKTSRLQDGNVLKTVCA